MTLGIFLQQLVLEKKYELPWICTLECFKIYDLKSVLIFFKHQRLDAYGRKIEFENE